MIKGAIFDADGTLLDSMSIWDTIAEDYLRSIGYEPRENLTETFKSFSLYQAACYYQKEYGVTLSSGDIIDGINAMIANFYEQQAQLKPGVENFLQQLRDNGVKMCIATATDKRLIETALARCGILNFFSEIFTCDSVGHGKEEPDIFRLAMKHLGTEKPGTFVFEDAFHAASTAKNDGFPVVAVWDASEENQMGIKAIADFYMKDFTEFESFWKLASK